MNLPMSTIINDFNVKTRYIMADCPSISVSVELHIHPLQLPREQITNIDCLCNGTTQWIDIGYLTPGITEDEYCYVIYERFFDDDIPFIGVKESSYHAIFAMVTIIKPYFTRLMTAPISTGV